MTSTREQLAACTVFIIAGLLCPSHSNGQLDAKSIVGVWLFDEASGDVARDKSGHGYDADLKESPAWVEGRFRHALEFQGRSYLEIRNSRENLAFGGTKPFSITTWVKNQGGGTAVGKFNGGIIGAYILTINGDGTVAFHREVEPWAFSGTKALPNNDFGHVAVTYDGAEMKIYVNGQFDAKQQRGAQNTDTVTPVLIGARLTNNVPSEFFSGMLDEVAIFNVALTEGQIRDVMDGLTSLKASNPNPQDGAIHEDTWVNLSWSPGDSAVSHDVYLGDTFSAVDKATPVSELFRGNQASPFYMVGIPGFAFPEGLVPGTTYYWRIDEVNAVHPDSPWRGDIWTFSVAPRTAYNPAPADGAVFVALDSKLGWTAGFAAKLHTVYFGDSSDAVSNATGGLLQRTTTYTPSGLQPEKVYHWRVDEFDGTSTHKGNMWAFTTPGAAGSPQPTNNATGVPLTAKLSWTPATNAVSHDIYFGTEKDKVKNATTASPEYKGNKAKGSERYEPGKLAWYTRYYWRVDATYNTGTVKGVAWSFTTADFIVVDDFESYNDIDPPDPASNRIFDKWIDGFASSTTNGALVGNDAPPYAEQVSVHGGAQSMLYRYDNANKTSEATLTLVYPRDWTEEGVGQLSLWFRGASTNSAERMYVALNGNAGVYHDNPAATQKTGWNQWVIDLQAFQGVTLTNINTITIGFGTKGSPAAAGTGKMYFDDIRLYRTSTL